MDARSVRSASAFGPCVLWCAYLAWCESATGRRYKTLAGYVLLSAALVVITVEEWIKASQDLLAWLDAHELGLPTTVAILAIAPRVLRTKFWTLVGYRHFCSYPPLWLAAVVGTFLIFSWWCAVPSSVHLEPPLGVPRQPLVKAGVLGFDIWLLVAVGWWLRRDLVPRERDATPKPALADRSRSFLEWVRDDDAIDFPSDDLFDLNRRAERIVRRLTETDGKESPTIAVVGERGSGKTSLGRLVKDRLGKVNASFELVQLSLWPYKDAEAAIAALTGGLVESMSRHVFAPTLRQVPLEYVRAFEGHSTWVDSVLRLVVPSSIAQTLGHLDAVAAAIGVRFVLWVDDLERFQVSGPASEPDAKDIAALRAFLYELDQLQFVSVVVATTNLSQSLDVEKLARYVEAVPTLDPSQVGRVVNELGTELLGADWRALSDHEEARVVLEFQGRHGRQYLLVGRTQGLEGPDVDDAINRSLRTPRLLKQALRHWAAVATVLAGELDMHDALVACVLKQADPPKFDALDQLMRSRMYLFSEERQSFLANGTEDSRALMRFIFSSMSESLGKAQGFASAARAYWQRFLEEEAIPPGSRDQELFEMIREFKNGNRAPLVHALDRDSPIEIFCGHGMTGDERCELAEDVWRQAQDQQWPGERKRVRHAISIVRWAVQRGEMHADTLAERMTKWIDATPASAIALVIEATVQVCEARKVYNWQLPPPHRKVLEDAVQAWVLAAYVDHDDALSNLCAGLEAAEYKHLWLACWGIDREELGKSFPEGVPFERWSELADRLLDAARLRPDVVLPALLPFVVLLQFRLDDSQKHEPTYNGVVAERLFGEKRLLDLFAGSPPVNLAEGQWRSMYQCVRNVALNASG